MLDLDAHDRRLLCEFQHDFPLSARPFAELGQRLGLDESDVRHRLARLQQSGAVSRVGAVFRANTVGASTLAAMQVPPDRLEQVAALVSAEPAVNHNYQRDHRLNLWFVVAAADQQAVKRVLDELSQKTGLPVLDLPMIQDFHIDLGFALSWT